MQDVIFKLHIKRPEVQAWLDRLRGTTNAHGADLAQTWRGGDGVYYAEKLLEALIEREWVIAHPTPTPTRDQQFFGVSGQDARSSKSTVIFGYKPGPDLPRQEGF